MLMSGTISNVLSISLIYEVPLKLDIEIPNSGELYQQTLNFNFEILEYF